MKLLETLISKAAVQVGFIIYGNGINARAFIAEARANGYSVRLCDNYAEIYK